MAKIYLHRRKLIKILWVGTRADLLISGGKDGIYDVHNGGWSLQLNLDTLEGTVLHTKMPVKFDRITDAPNGTDYNDILRKATFKEKI